MKDYIEEYFETGALNPYINFALFCLSFILSIATIIWRIV